MNGEEAAPDDLKGTIQQSGEALTASKDLSIPKEAKQHADAPTIAGYLLTSPLGRGAFAQVWKGWQVRTRKWVAVKVFTQRGGVNWIFLQREVERLIKLDKHPHIVSLLDADLTGETAYYVMDFLEGGSLEQFVDPANPAPVEKAVRWMEEICEALAYVHSKGLIHCDLKPANILLDEEGHVRVADFGQSRIVTESSSALGTLFYMAPEQAVVAHEGTHAQPDVRWDVYGLGATMCAVLTGREPHGDDASRKTLEAARGLEEKLALYKDLVMRQPVPNCLEATQGRADEDLAAIVAKCVLPRPESRYRALSETSADLAARREGRPVSLLAWNRFYRWRKWASRSPLALAALALSVILAWAGVGEILVGKARMEELDAHRLDERTSVARALALDLRDGLKTQGLRDGASAAAASSFIEPRRKALEARLRSAVGREVSFARAASMPRGGAACALVAGDWSVCLPAPPPDPPDRWLMRYLMAYWWAALRSTQRDLTAGGMMNLFIVACIGLFALFGTFSLALSDDFLDLRLRHRSKSLTAALRDERSKSP
jgi:hypothetical protein